MEGNESNDWFHEFGDVFNSSLQKDPTFFWNKQLQVCHREIQWNIPYSRIPPHNAGIRYYSRDVKGEEIQEFLDMLLSQGVIRKLEPDEKAMFSPMLFLRKPNGKIGKTIDFRLLNSYYKPWVTSQTDVHMTLASIPVDWDHFTILDIEQLVF